MAALKPAAEKRGPRIGDAASLWNFTPAPGWTKEEAQILKLCLMKHGVGRWIQILEMGLLPGKLIQQLNGQTQRLLGQQSLAAYTGLQVDIDRIRADNDKLVDAERKNGLVINSGPNLTKQQKQQLQEEAKAKYGLSLADIQEVEDLLQELVASRGLVAGGAAGGGAASALPEAKAAAAGAVQGRAQREAELLARDTTGMSREQKINFLLHLREKLQQAAGRLAKAAAAAGAAAAQLPLPAAAGGAAAPAAAGPAAASLPLTTAPEAPPPATAVFAPQLVAVPAVAGSTENEGVVANAAPMQLDAPPAAAAGAAHQRVSALAGKPAARTAAVAGGGRKAAAGDGKRKAVGGSRQARQASSSSDDDWDWQPKPRGGLGSRSRRGGGSAAAAAAPAAPQAMEVDESAAAVLPVGAELAVPPPRAAAAAAAASSAADVEQLVAMGFSAKQARDALEESGSDLEAAIEWLVANCM